MHPHILLITIDSLRADHLSCYGQPRAVLTPNLDASAGSGARFEQHLTSLAVTLASHCSLLTGCTPAVHGVTWNGMTVARRRRTLPEIVAPLGYATAAITSWAGFQHQGVYGFQQAYSQDSAAALEN